MKVQQPCLLIFDRFLLISTNLKDGSGDPIAGHNKLSVWSAFSVNVRLSDFCENFGLAPPIGSKSIVDFR